MASPPHAPSPTAISPPNPSPAQLPNKKRPSEGGAQPSQKRRKPSTLSVASGPSSAHPLRQTSFPPEARSPLARSPSVDTTSHVSGSQVSAPSGPPKKKRGRKPKNAQKAASNADSNQEATPSLAGGKAGTNVSGADGQGGAGEDGGADDDDDNDMQMGLVGGETRTQEQKQEEIRLRAMLVESFDPEQMDRYEQWRAGKLTEAVVKRVVNATVSQSVPPTVTLAIKSVSKYFIGELIEKAIDVQREWMHATDEKQSDAPLPPREDTSMPGDVNRLDERDKRAPLRPDHLREAWRRYKQSGESGWVGTRGLWHDQQNDGVERFPIRTGGKRIFK